MNRNQGGFVIKDTCGAPGPNGQVCLCAIGFCDHVHSGGPYGSNWADDKKVAEEQNLPYYHVEWIPYD